MSEQIRYKRKWYQFSLRTLLILVAVFSVLMGLIGWKFQKIREWQILLAKLNRQPYVEWSYGNPDKLYFLADPLANFSLTDEDIATVGKISTLSVFLIDYAPNVTDNGIKHLSGLKSLRILELSNTRITDEGLRYLKALPNLESLDLNGNIITDKGLSHLQALPKLIQLKLEGTNVTNAGLAIIEKMPNIRYLWVGPLNPKLTDEALEKLRRIKPQCDVLTNDGVDPQLDYGKPNYLVRDRSIPMPDKIPGEIRILVSEIMEPGIGALMICTVKKEQLDRLKLRPEDIQTAGPQILATLKNQFPAQAIDLFLKGMLSSESNSTKGKADAVEELLTEGIFIEFNFGPSVGSSSFENCFRTTSASSAVPANK